MVSSSCKTCVFAEWKNEPTPHGVSPVKGQTGCRMGFLDKFEEQGVLKTESENGVTHHIIEGRMCRACIDKKDDFAKIIPFEDQVGAMRVQMITNVDPVIVIDEPDLDKLKVTIDCLNAQDLPPRQAQFISLCPVSEFAKLRDFVNEHMNSKEYPHAIAQIHVKGLSVNRTIDTAVGYLERDGWYVILRLGQTIPPNFFSAIDKSLNIDLARFSILRPPAEDMHGLVVQTGFHKSSVINGNMGHPIFENLHGEQKFHSIIDKTELYIKNCLEGEEPEDKSHLLQNLTDIVPEMA